ncbi:hypothetical protein ARMGADRAFT_1022952 [Armillaria gallica]|uniref:Uncharacterized protein n=1 Tax=Armillaria gallica TaxID=47427 RepID=A0A2H3EEB7_ARMGA|nr:hypothetical protein ARMGADRAFT_1022952 [Armillaria gallica]
MPTHKRVPFADATNTNMVWLVVETCSPSFSASPVSLTSLLNGRDNPHFPVPPQTNALGFDYGLDALDDFFNTIINDELELGSDSLATHHSPASVDPRGKAIKPTSWAAKNPTHLLAPTRVHCEVASQHFPVTEVSSAAVKKRLAREKKEAFANDLTESMEEHLERLKEILSKHGKKFKDVLCIAGSAGRYKNHHAVSDLQAKILYQTKENNEGKPIGAKLRLEQLQELVKTDPRCDELTEEEIQNLKEEIYVKRLDKQQGARISHRSAANDYRHTSSHGHWTGACGFAILSRGSVDDTMPPSLLQIPGLTAFLSTIVKFEQFSCTVDHKACEDQSSIRKDITRLIYEGLEAITHVKGANMNYQNYEKSITTTCQWMRLAETEMEELTESILSCEGNGEIVGKKRKERSDKGGSHKLKKHKNKVDHTRGQKHARKGAKLPDISRSHSAEDSDGSDNSAENEDGIE